MMTVEQQNLAHRAVSALEGIQKGGNIDGEVLLTTDVKLMQQLEASFCVAREVDKKGEILIDPNDPTHGGKVCAAASSGQ